ncbi:MAG: DUF4173 domain-containing protein [Flavobacterium sp.]|nr:DUF4173 domain-containing protein [Candidatus Neoflavobacterium equi]
MKKHLLILFSTLIFVLLFYSQNIGLNLSLFGLLLLGASLYQFPELTKHSKGILLSCTTFLILCSNAYLCTPMTVFMTFVCLVLLRLYAENKPFKLLFSIPVVFCVGAVSLVRPFLLDTWLPKGIKVHQFWVKFFALFFVPLFVIFIFAVLYMQNSDLMYAFYNRYELDLDWVLFPVLGLGFYLSYAYWDAYVPEVFHKENLNLSDNFEIKPLPNTALIPDQFLKLSGVITLGVLHLLLGVFIVGYVVEHLVQPDAVNLSEATHEIVFSLIFSIVLAVVVLLFYFNGRLNFLDGIQTIKRMSYLWLLLNGFLVVLCVYKNTLYIQALGLTEKRLGVYLFLALCAVGLCLTFYKIQYKKTTAFLVERMSWAVYISFVIIGFFNWNGLIVAHNIKYNHLDYSSYYWDLKGAEMHFVKLMVSERAGGSSKVNRESTYNGERSLTNCKKHWKEPFLSSELYYMWVCTSEEVQEVQNNVK